MTDDSLDFRDTENPYQTPTAESIADAVPYNWLRIPAIATITLASIYWVLLFFFMIVELGNYRYRHSSEVLLLSGLLLYQMLMSFMIVGAVCMIRLRRLWLARLAAFASCIPILSPFYIATIPFGIWSLVLLFQSKTVERFQFGPKSPSQIDNSIDEH